MDVAAANAERLESWKLSLIGGHRRKSPRTVQHYMDETQRFAGWLTRLAQRAEAADIGLVTDRALSAYDNVDPMADL